MESSGSDAGKGVPTGTVGLWTANGNSLDVVGTSNGTLIGGATYANGVHGQAFSFDGVDDYVSLGNISVSGSVSVSAWINTNDIAEGQLASIVSKWGQTTAVDAFSLTVGKTGVLSGRSRVYGTNAGPDTGLSGGVIRPGFGRS